MIRVHFLPECNCNIRVFHKHTKALLRNLYSMYLQFRYLCAQTDVGKCEIRNQEVHTGM